MVDLHSGGRAGLALVGDPRSDESGPGATSDPVDRSETISALRALWSSKELVGPSATDLEPIHPRPVAKDLPLWIATDSTAESWRAAGREGCHVLSRLTSPDVLARRIADYRAAREEAGHGAGGGLVTIVLPTCLGVDEAIIREHLKEHLRNDRALLAQYAEQWPPLQTAGQDAAPIDPDDVAPDQMDALLDFACAQCLAEGGLFGTVEDAVARVGDFKTAGVDEIACLVDFGVERQAVLEGLQALAEVVARNARPEKSADHGIAAQISRHGVTHLQCTPTGARLLLSDPATRQALGQLSHMSLWGEPLPGSLVAELGEATAAGIETFYGEAETTIWATSQAAVADQALCPIGTPMANVRCYVLGESMALCPVGQPGELWIGGAGVARGYHGQDDLTAERFRPDPFAPGRIFRTGDLARWRSDGTLECLGPRADSGDGRWLETGQIEAALVESPLISQAVVVRGDEGLTAFVVGERLDDGLLENERRRLTGRLPPRMIPARIVEVDAFPLTSDLKVDRAALARGFPAGQATGQDEGAGAHARSPRDIIAAVWREVLGVGGPQDSVLEAAGSPLQAVMMHRKLRERLDMPRLSIADLCRYPTPAALAERIEALRKEQPDALSRSVGTARTSGSMGATIAQFRAARDLGTHQDTAG